MTYGRQRRTRCHEDLLQKVQPCWLQLKRANSPENGHLPSTLAKNFPFGVHLGPWSCAHQTAPNLLGTAKLGQHQHSGWVSSPARLCLTLASTSSGLYFKTSSQSSTRPPLYLSIGSSTWPPLMAPMNRPILYHPPATSHHCLEISHPG